ncbi:MAG: zinc-ribbon domain-containing protein [Candidatus Dojkabacteria bacterium]
MNLENIILDFFNFVGNVNFNLFGIVLALLILVFWIVLIGWVWIDSAERTSNKQWRLAYLFLVIFFNIPGLIIYFIIRPSETIEQVYWEDLERRYLKYETAELGDCSKCGSQLLPGYVFCVNCGNEIKRKCPNCQILIIKGVKFCPHCGTQVAEKATQQEQPSVEVMEQQILANKEHMVDTVESDKLRYKQRGDFIVKLGDVVIGGWKKLTGAEKKEDEQKSEQDVVKSERVDKKKRKKKKRRKK